MILTCPNCSTQYVVKDGAIPPQGRQVRCAACKHSWHQDPEDGAGDAADADQASPIATDEIPFPGDEADGQFDSSATPKRTASPADEYADGRGEGGESGTGGANGDDESLAEAVMIEPRSGPEAEMRAYEEAIVESAPEEVAVPAEPVAEAPLDESVYDHQESRTAAGPASAADWNASPEAEPDEDFSPFAPVNDPEPRSRRPLVAIIVGVLVVAAVAALFWFLAPDSWKNRVGLAGSSNSPLALVTTHMDRQRLESGNELLTVTGRVINPTGKEQPVPPLQAQLKARGGRVVYSWTIAPPAQSLPAGASASFNSAEVNVPPGGEELTLTLGPPRA